MNMKSYMLDIERFVMVEKYDPNVHEDTVTILFRVVEHGKGGKVDVKKIVPTGINRSYSSDHEFNSLQEFTEQVNDKNSELRGELEGRPLIASKQAVLRWAGRFSHFDIEKMFI